MFDVQNSRTGQLFENLVIWLAENGHITGEDFSKLDLVYDEDHNFRNLDDPQGRTFAYVTKDPETSHIVYVNLFIDQLPNRNIVATLLHEIGHVVNGYVHGQTTEEQEAEEVATDQWAIMVVPEYRYEDKVPYKRYDEWVTARNLASVPDTFVQEIGGY